MDYFGKVLVRLGFPHAGLKIYPLWTSSVKFRREVELVLYVDAQRVSPEFYSVVLDSSLTGLST